MKNVILVIMVWLVAAAHVNGQKWSDLTDEEKMMKLKTFRAENQKFLKDSLKLTQTQMTDIDNVNICYLSTLDRINRYVKDDASKQKYAETISKGRWAQMDAIMGVDNHNKYAAYLKKKIEAASKAK